MSAHPLAEYRCHALTHLKKQPRADEAQSLVKRLAEQAQPIMAIGIRRLCYAGLDRSDVLKRK